MTDKKNMEAIIFMGPQASGKSSFFKHHFYDTHIRVNLDMLRTRNREESYVRNCLNVSQPFVVDNTNPLLKDRERYITLIKEYKVKVVGYYFYTTLEENLKRNAQRKKEAKIPNCAIISTYNKFVLPKFEEGFDELYVVRPIDGQFYIEPYSENSIQLIKEPRSTFIIPFDFSSFPISEQIKKSIIEECLEKKGIKAISIENHNNICCAEILSNKENIKSQISEFMQNVIQIINSIMLPIPTKKIFMSLSYRSSNSLKEKVLEFWKENQNFHFPLSKEKKQLQYQERKMFGYWHLDTAQTDILKRCKNSEVENLIKEMEDYLKKYCSNVKVETFY